MGTAPPADEVRAKLIAQLENPHLREEDVALIEKKLEILDAKKQ